MNLLQKRARNSLLGLAVGDAIGWPAMFHRSLLLPPWTRRIRREIDVQREDAGVLRVPMPFSLNQPAGAFSPCPTDDTEWAAWTMKNLLANGCAVEERWVADEWLSLAAQEKGVRGGVSTHAAIENLRRGILPPFSGRDNPHYFDDGSMCRAVPIGIACAGNPALAASATRIDAAVTNFEDGIWTACAVAAAVSIACAGGDRQSVIDAALNALPTDSWSRLFVE
jgi:ADP-ribosylglycohydrolase